MVAKIQRLSDFHATLSWLVLAAPDGFTADDSKNGDQGAVLQEAFDQLNDGFHFVEGKIKDPVRLQQLRQLLRDSLPAYRAGDDMKGAYLLQDFLNIVFPNRFKEYEQRKGIPT